VNKPGGRRSGPPTPAVVGIARSMRARDVSKPRPPEQQNPAPHSERTQDQDAESGNGGSSPVDS
jgi:hypothetical protein